MSTSSTAWHTVKRSKLHGNGVFAARNIPAGTTIFEYIGARISAEEADEMPSYDPDEIIDGGQGGNDARWINHSCEPNCEAQEDDAGERVFIVPLHDIPKGQELFYDYGLVIDDEITDELKAQYC